MTRFSHGPIHGEITTMPGCTQVAISHGVFSRERGSGQAVEANQKRCAAMLGMGYDYALCTVDAANVVQTRILEKNGWKYLSAFKSTKTGHTVNLYGRSLE